MKNPTRPYGLIYIKAVDKHMKVLLVCFCYHTFKEMQGAESRSLLVDEYGSLAIIGSPNH